MIELSRHDWNLWGLRNYETSEQEKQKVERKEEEAKHLWQVMSASVWEKRLKAENSAESHLWLCYSLTRFLLGRKWEVLHHKDRQVNWQTDFECVLQRCSTKKVRWNFVLFNRSCGKLFILICSLKCLSYFSSFDDKLFNRDRRREDCGHERSPQY